jgi:hypothetical protein
VGRGFLSFGGQVGAMLAGMIVGAMFGAMRCAREETGCFRDSGTSIMISFVIAAHIGWAVIEVTSMSSGLMVPATEVGVSVSVLDDGGALNLAGIF